jgi:tetratricopeptide (TPR) repeat protein
MRCRSLIGVAVAALLLAGCAATPAHKQAADSAADVRAAGPQFNQALGLMHANHYSQAIPLLDTVTKAQPTLSLAVLNLAIAQARSGHDAQAEPLLRQVLTQNPANPVALNELGMLQRRAGHFTEARQAYERAIAANAGYADAELNLAILYDLYLQQPAQAVPHYRRYQALADTPDKRVTLWIAELSKTAKTVQSAKSD